MKVSEMTNEELLADYRALDTLALDSPVHAELLRRLNAEPAPAKLSADVAQDAQHLGTAANHKSSRLVSEGALDLASQPSAESLARDAEPGKPRCPEDFLQFFAKWWAGMDLDKLRESMNDPLWVDGKHCGDCTKQAHTCNRCALEDIEKQAAMFAQFFPAERQEGWVSVKDRLPEYGEEVIVYCPNKDRRRITALARFTGWEGSPDFHWDNAYPGKGNLHLQTSVTHWRPLPAPPSAPADEKENPGQ